MNLSLKWASDFVKHTAPIEQFVSDMTMSGSKVEGYVVEGAEIENVVVGKVISIEKHSGADSLFVCQLDVGGHEPVQIVTGATNVVAGALVPVAMDGSTIAGGKKIKKGKLRGELSCGMLCSLSELGLASGDFPYANEDGIFLIEEDCKVGENIRTAIGLNDTVVEFEITPNRPDCLSVIGLAREIAATYKLPFTLPQPQVKGSGGDINDLLSVTVQNGQLCQRYCAAGVRNVKIEPSPRWMRERLRASGVRPISNIVDITNYVMLEYGHPMHAFDLKHVAGGQIIVRNAVDGEKITTLDGNTRTLQPEMLVIADQNSPSAIAGIMGGEYSGIYADTNTVIFEAACFKGANVRASSRKLGLRTESSGKFEKGLDPENCMGALRRACQLVELLGAGEVVDGIIDVNNSQKPQTQIPLCADWINTFIGTQIPQSQMIEMLALVGLTVCDDIVCVPSYRGDILCKADIAEEIARMYGYDRIPSTALHGSAQGKFTDSQRFERGITNVLLSQGYNEIVTYSFISPKYYDKINLPQDSPLRNCVVITNPLGEDTGVMRTTGVPSMMEIIARNYNNRNPKASLFEIATQYTPVAGSPLPLEKKHAIFAFYGGGDFFNIKGTAECLLDFAGIKNWDIVKKTDDPTFHSGRCAEIFVSDKPLGIIGEIHPAVCKNYGVGAKVYLAMLDLELLLDCASLTKQYSPLPRFPCSTRDLALVCDESLPAMDMQKAIAKASGAILQKVELFDVYRGAQIGQGKKSVAYSLTLQATDRTLTDDECDKVVAKALAALKKIGVQIRA